MVTGLPQPNFLGVHIQHLTFRRDVLFFRLCNHKLIDLIVGHIQYVKKRIILQKTNASHPGILNPFFNISSNLLFRMDVLQHSEEGFYTVSYRRDSVFSNKWFFGLVYLVAEMAIFNNNLHKPKIGCINKNDVPVFRDNAPVFGKF